MGDNEKPAAAKEKPAAPKAKAVLDFNTLFLDTNVLIDSNWPSVSVRLEAVLSLAQWCQLVLVIPEPVEKEAEEHWRRNVRDSVTSLESAAGKFRRLSRGIEGSVEISLDKEEDLIRKYREATSRLKERYKIAGCRMTSRPLVEVFDLATRYVMPFEESKKGKGRGEGKGFQDAVILSSILEHLKANPEISGALVTNDGPLLQVDVATFMPSCADIRLRVLTLDEVSESVIDKYMDEHIMKPWEEERQNALNVVTGMAPELYKFVQEKLQDLPLSEIGVVGLERLDKVLGVKSIKPLYVQTPMPDPAKPDRSVRMAIALTVDLDALGLRTQVDPFSLLVARRAAGISNPQYDTGTATWFGGIEATADVRARQFTNVKLLSLVSMEEIGRQKWFSAIAEG